MPERKQALEALKTTDLHQTVLLEDFNEPAEDAAPTDPPPAKVKILDYQPNRVAIDTDSAWAGYLVLADVWYPGWTCSVDGLATPIYRADHLFRGVEVPAGQHEVVFRFEPESLRVGRIITLITLGLIGFLSLTGSLLGRFRARSDVRHSSTEALESVP